MSESKLRTQSMDFAVSIINLVKYLKEKRESIISNQIGSDAHLSVQISVKHNMLTAKQTSLQNCKLLSKKQTKPDIGWNCCLKQITCPKKNIKFLTPLVQVFVSC